MRYGSLCSGIEAASVAWEPLGWSPAFFSEIATFPSAVLAHHYGSNMPDSAPSDNGVPNYGDMTDFERWPDHAIDILVGGTPCQDYSIAGLRAGMAGDRGSLTLTYIQIAARYRPDWIVWENVPGVLSSNSGRDFARFLGDLSGTKISVPADGWKNSGIIEGIGDAYGLAYRVLDAQYVRVDGFGRAVPQRRRRVFVIGYLADWRRAAAVLFEPESLQGNTAPSRKAGEGFASGTLRSTDGGSDVDHARAGHLIGPVAARMTAFGEYVEDGTASTVKSRDHKDATDLIAHSLRAEGFDASEDGTGRGTPLVPVAFSSKDFVGDAMFGVSPTLRAGSHGSSHPNAGIPPAVAFDLRGRDGGAMPEGPHDTAAILAASGGSSRSYVASPQVVRRVTPRECERLQGFPVGYTQISWRNKEAALCPDGPQYMALGNSMAVNVMRWIGVRIDMVNRLRLFG